MQGKQVRQELWQFIRMVTPNRLNIVRLFQLLSLPSDLLPAVARELLQVGFVCIR